MNNYAHDKYHNLMYVVGVLLQNGDGNPTKDVKILMFAPRRPAAAPSLPLFRWWLGSGAPSD